MVRDVTMDLVYSALCKPNYDSLHTSLKSRTARILDLVFCFTKGKLIHTKIKLYLCSRSHSLTLYYINTGCSKRKKEIKKEIKKERKKHVQ